MEISINDIEPMEKYERQIMNSNLERLLRIYKNKDDVEEYYIDFSLKYNKRHQIEYDNKQIPFDESNTFKTTLYNLKKTQTMARKIDFLEHYVNN